MWGTCGTSLDPQRKGCYLRRTLTEFTTTSLSWGKKNHCSVRPQGSFGHRNRRRSTPEGNRRRRSCGWVPLSSRPVSGVNDPRARSSSEVVLGDFVGVCRSGRDPVCTRFRWTFSPCFSPARRYGGVGSGVEVIHPPRGPSRPLPRCEICRDKGVLCRVTGLSLVMGGHCSCLLRP